MTGAGEAFGVDRGWRGARDGRGWRIDRGDRRVSGGRGGFAPKKSAGAVAPARRSLEIEEVLLRGGLRGLHLGLGRLLGLGRSLLLALLVGFLLLGGRGLAGLLGSGG